MFGEDTGENFEKFADGARISIILSNLVGVVFLSVVFFPCLALLPLTLPLGAWYGIEYLKRLRFRLDKTYFFVRKGVILYSYTLVPYENVQDVHVVQGYVDRIFGVWKVVLFTATASIQGSECVFGLSRESAEKLRTAIFKKMKEARHVTD